MSQRPSEVMRKWFDRVWCCGDETCIDELFAVDGIATGLHGGAVLRGPAGFRSFFHGMRATFSEIRVDVVEAIDEGDRCYTQCVATLGFRGKEITLEGGALSTVRAGQIVASHNCWDFLALMQKMGALEADVFPRAAMGAQFCEKPASAAH